MNDAAGLRNYGKALEDPSSSARNQKLLAKLREQGSGTGSAPRCGKR
jgi:hypothetical protein